MAAHPALIKRPVFEIDGRVIVGFKDEQRRLLEDG
jgi:arsenate reductase-like glutaredoxin family protein